MPTRTTITAALAATLGACMTAPATQPIGQPIAGVQMEETSFFASSVENVLRGDNDVIFVRAAGRWYRVALNAGCMRAVASRNPTFTFASQGTSRVDRFTRVTVSDGGAIPFSCRAESIRESAAPPMVDSSSVVPRG